MSEDGLRVLAVAYRWLEARAAYSRDDEADLVLAGFVSFADPVLPDAADVLAELKRDGVTVKILTGDNELVARHVCEQLGAGRAADRHGRRHRADSTMPRSAIGGADRRSSRGSRPRRRTGSFSRLKRRGHVVGFMGDGINDAPSLHTADVGISVMTAADVARDAADIILGQPEPARAASWDSRGPPGLRQHDEVPADGDQLEFRQHVQHGGGVGVPAVPADAADADSAEQLPLRPGPGNDPRVNVNDYLRRPTALGHGIIRDFMLFIGPISSVFDFLTFYVLLHPSTPRALFHTGWFVESLATQTLVLFVIRTTGNPFRSRPSRA